MAEDIREDDGIVFRFVVDRSRWGRGGGEGNGTLLNSVTGKMCCLGFACLAAGHSAEEIDDMRMPSDIEPPLLPRYGTSAIALVAQINDFEGFDDVDREARIIEVLADIGIAVSFVDGPVP